MGKASLSVGDDTPDGEPENGPKGPYIGLDDDGTHPKGDHLPPNDAGSREHLKQVREHSRTETVIAEDGPLASDRGGEAPASGDAERQPNLSNDLAKRPKGPAQPK